MEARTPITKMQYMQTHRMQILKRKRAMRAEEHVLFHLSRTQRIK